jgi:predicted membrane GTPase involved in stress response
MIFRTLFLLLFSPAFIHGQGYTSFFSGDTADVTTEPIPGIVLAGGGGDNDQAMQWMLERADSGDVVVLRASGSDENVDLAPPTKVTIERGLEIMSSDEYLEITPKSTRLRKKILDEGRRIKADK